MADLQVDLAVDNRQAIRGVKDFGAALEEVADDLKDVSKAGDALENSLADNYRDIAKAAKRSGDQSGKALKEGLKDAKDEAGSSGREAAASFSGGFEDVTDFVQETLANALGGFGPAGAAAGIALAAGLGAALQGLADQQEKIQAARDAARELAQTLYENKGTVPVAEQIDRIFDTLAREQRSGNFLTGLVDTWADFGDTLAGVRRVAGLTGGSMQSLTRALGGSRNDIAKNLDAVNDKLAELEGNVATGWAWNPDLVALRNVQTELKNVQDANRLAAESAGAVGAAYDTEEAQEKIRTLGQAWQDNAVDAANYWTTAEDGATTFDWKAYLTDAENALRDANAYKEKIVGLPADIRTEAQRVFEEQGAGAAVGYIDAFNKSSAKNKQRFVNAAKANGEAAGKAQGKALADASYAAARGTAQGLGPIPVQAKVALDDSAVRNYYGTVHVNAVIDRFNSARRLTGYQVI